MRKCALALTLCLQLVGCASWLPESHTDTTPFPTFEQAQEAVLSLVPMQSGTADLDHNGFNLKKHPNSQLLNHADVIRRFLAGSVLRREDLDQGIVACLEARDDCHGIEVIGAKIRRERKGSFWADFFNFQRRTETTGWRFDAVVLLVKDRVVYRSWSGQPDINEVEVTRNPLGPFQDIGPAQANSAVVPK